MPCDSIQLNSVELGKMNGALLTLALRELGATNVQITGRGAYFMLGGVPVRIQDGRMIVRAGYEHLADRVKVAYSRQAVQYAAKKNGWKVKEVKPNVFQVVK